jgi:hypothetical protein
MDMVNFVVIAGRKTAPHAPKPSALGMFKGALVARSLFALLILAGLAGAEEFSIVIGSPVAARSSLAKHAFMAIRTKGCDDLSKLTVAGKAEGLVNGARRSMPLTKIAPMSAPGVYAVYPEWTGEGAWLLSLTAHCGVASAYALVPVGPQGFSRESSKFLTRPPAEPEIEAILKPRKE